MRIRATNTLAGLVADLSAAPAKFASEAPAVVERNANKGNTIAQRFAREKSGPHGKNYYKRLSAEMTGNLTAEYGPHDGGTPVGAGFRHGGVNMDLPNSADIIGPYFAEAVGELADRLFW
jgi:hypothetical protein